MAAVGDVAVRVRRGVREKWTKVADTPGGGSRNWRRSSAVEWEKANGRPVPPGMRVHLKDGDPMNVEPSNLELLSPADLLGRYHVEDEERSRAQLARCHAAAGRHNKLRGRLHPLREMNETWYYAADPLRRIVVGSGADSIWRLLGRHKVARAPWCRSGAGLLAAMSGWPELGDDTGPLLMALVEARRPLTYDQALLRANALRARFGARPLARGSCPCLFWKLRKGGWISSRRNGGGHGCPARPSTHWATGKAIGAARRPWRLVPMRGKDVRGWTRCDGIDEKGAPRGLRLPDPREGAGRLARVVLG